MNDRPGGPAPGRPAFPTAFSMKEFPLLTCLTAVVALAVATSSNAMELFQFERTALARGEVWRLWTGHLTHFGFEHLKWDVIAFLAFGSLVELRSRRAWWICLGLGALVISAGVGVFQPQFTTYRGLSGIDSALFAFVVADLMRDGWTTRDRPTLIIAVLALAGFLAKSGYELVTGLTVFVPPSTVFEPVPLAHLLGAAIGIGGALCFSRSFHSSPSEVGERGRLLARSPTL